MMNASGGSPATSISGSTTSPRHPARDCSTASCSEVEARPSTRSMSPLSLKPSPQRSATPAADPRSAVRACPSSARTSRDSDFTLPLFRSPVYLPSAATAASSPHSAPPPSSTGARASRDPHPISCPGTTTLASARLHEAATSSGRRPRRRDDPTPILCYGAGMSRHQPRSDRFPNVVHPRP